LVVIGRLQFVEIVDCVHCEITSDADVVFALSVRMSAVLDATVNQGPKLFGTLRSVMWGRGSCMGSVTVPLDRVLLSSCRLSIVTIQLSVTVWPQFAMQILARGSDPKSPFLVGDRI